MDRFDDLPNIKRKHRKQIKKKANNKIRKRSFIKN